MIHKLYGTATLITGTLIEIQMNGILKSEVAL